MAYSHKMEVAEQEYPDNHEKPSKVSIRLPIEEEGPFRFGVFLAAGFYFFIIFGYVHDPVVRWVLIGTFIVATLGAFVAILSGMFRVGGLIFRRTYFLEIDEGQITIHVQMLGRKRRHDSLGAWPKRLKIEHAY